MFKKFSLNRLRSKLWFYTCANSKKLLRRMPLNWPQIIFSDCVGRLLCSILILFIILSPACLKAEEAVSDEGILYLSIDDVSALALYNSLDIQIARYDAYAKRSEILDSESIFDTILSAEVSYEDNQLKPSNTVFGAKSLTSKYSLGLSKKMPSGTTLGLEAADERSWSDSVFASINPAHDTSLKVSLQQSLGKNFFGFIDRGNVVITKLEIRASDYSSLGKIEEYLSQAQKAYWKLVLTKEELRIKKEMLKEARNLLSIYKDKFSMGLVEDPEILAVRILVLKREADLLSAYDLLNLAKDDLLFQINAAEENFSMSIEVGDELSFLPEKQDFFKTLKIAILHRRDYKEAKLLLEAKDIDVELKENNLWPEIDLDASFKRNGLDSNFSHALKAIGEEDNPDLYVGLTFSLALENREAKGKMKRAEIAKAKQIILLKKTEKKIVSQIHRNVKQVNLAIGKVLTNKRILVLEGRKLYAQNLRFSFGRSDSDTIIRYQEDLLLAKLALVESISAYKSALIDLEVATNTLLDKHWNGQVF